MINYKIHSEDWWKPKEINTEVQIDRDFIFTYGGESYCIDRFEIDLEESDSINIYLENLNGSTSMYGYDEY